MKKKKAAQGSLNQTNQQYNTIHLTDNYTQRATIIKVLKDKPHNTFELRAMGICSPATRILELKQRGYRIDKILITAQDQSGVEHRGIAQYFLLPSKNEG